MLSMTPEHIIKNNLVNDDTLGKHLNKIKESTYGFQKKLQLDSVTLERYDFNMGDFNKKIVDDTANVIRHKYMAFVDFDFITPQKKLKFKRSGLSGTELSQYDISTKPEIFDRNFMLFIEGKLIDSVRIIPNEQGVKLVVSIMNNTDKIGIDENVFKNWRTNKAKASIVFFTNSSFNPLITNRAVLAKNKYQLSLKESGIVDELESDEKYVTFVRNNKLGVSSDLVFTPQRDEMISFFEAIDSDENYQKAYVNIYGFKNLSKEIKLDIGERFFQLPNYKMPIPVGNLMVFSETSEGRKFATDVVIKQYYPNFYEVLGTVNTKLSILVFFSEQNSEVEGYDNELKEYYDLMGDNIESFNKAPDIVKNFTPYELNYSIEDYLNSGYSSPLEYKIHKMSESADGNVNYLVEYLKDQYQTSNGLFVNMSNVDLESRIRENNHNEIIDEFKHAEFDSPRYVITLKDMSENGKYVVNYYIDGIRYVPDEMYERGKYSYIYIPKDMIKPDTYIEIERFEVFNNHTKSSVTDTNRIMYIDVNDKYNRHDISLVDVNGNYMNPSDFKVYSINNDNTFTYYEVGDYSFIPEGRVYIQLNRPGYNDTVDIYVNKYHQVNLGIIEEDGQIMESDIHVETYPYANSVRGYTDGRFIYKDYVNSYHTGNQSDDVRVSIDLIREKGTKTLFEYLPVQYNEIMFLKYLPQGNLIYLNNIIDRPFSLSWYDVYVNGRKLNKNNIRIISPYLIEIVNLESVKNFAIYSISLPDDPFVFNGNKTIIDMLWETDKPFQDALLGRDSNVIDIEQDIISEAINFVIKNLLSFWREVMTAKFYHINPDINQITTDEIIKYNHFLKDRPVVHLNGEIEGEPMNVEVLHINPDR